MKTALFFLFVLMLMQGAAQDTARSAKQVAPPLSARKWTVGALTAATYGGSFVVLNKAWYADYPRRSFHTFNDNGEWLQMDKWGHGWTGYHTSRLGTGLWRWAGVAPNTAVLLGAGSSLLYMLSIEYLDGLSAEWGWSWGDAGADFFGASLFAAQEWAWQRQRFSLKFSASPMQYNDPLLAQRADKLFGHSFQGRLLKDYNAQTYWLSGNLHDFFPQSGLPAWLNVAVGYGAGGMFGGFENLAHDKNGAVTFDRRDIKRYRQWYLAPDIDLTKIKTRSKLLKTALSVANVLKIPSPALQLSKGKLRVMALAY